MTLCSYPRGRISFVDLEFMRHGGFTQITWAHLRSRLSLMYSMSLKGGFSFLALRFMLYAEFW